jgi:hypothetical protein
MVVYIKGGLYYQPINLNDLNRDNWYNYSYI